MSQTTKNAPLAGRDGVSRRAAMKRVVVSAAGMAVGWAVLGTGTAQAQATMSKASVAYQDRPERNESCLNCSLFVPGKTPDAMGTCKVVKGAISPNGWCNIWSAKS